MKLVLTGVALAALLSASSGEVQAQAAHFDPSLRSISSDGIQTIQYRRFRGGGFRAGGFRGGGVRPGYRGGGVYHGGYARGGYVYRGGGYRYGGYGGYGYPVAAGVAGLATGALIGGAIASQAQPTYVVPGGDSSSYCASRYKSYDPQSGTFLGYDGNRHPCP